MIGRISTTTDLNVVYDNLSSSKIITIVDVDNVTEQLKAISTIACFLLPPYEVINEKICNENDDLFISLYSQYLHQGEAFEFIAILYKVLCQGDNVILYFPTDYEMFAEELIGLLSTQFGFWFGGEIGLSPAFNIVINSVLYLFDLISSEELLNSTINILDYSQEVIAKLSIDLYLPYTNMNYNDLVDYLNNKTQNRGKTGNVLHNIWRVDNSANVY